jgi:hypothetical protein
MDVEKKRKQEQYLISDMIGIYCKGKHKYGHKASGLCPDCAGLKSYAEGRIGKCPHMETKTFCSNCQTHCFKPEMREKIRAVMRHSGPRIIFKHPLLVIKHAFYSRRKKNETTKV